MLNESSLPKVFWGECLAALIHVWNRCPTKSNEGLTSYQLWHRKKPDISHLCVWGCTAYIHVQKGKRANLEPHMKKCVFIGYPDRYKGWKFYDPMMKHTSISERAEFNEQHFIYKTPNVNNGKPMSNQYQELTEVQMITIHTEKNCKWTPTKHRQANNQW